jgi:hypothetical protein
VQNTPPFRILVYCSEIPYALILYGYVWRGTHTGLVLRNHTTRITGHSSSGYWKKYTTSRGMLKCLPSLQSQSHLDTKTQLYPGVSTKYTAARKARQIVVILGIFRSLSLGTGPLKQPLDLCQQAPRVEPHTGCATLGLLHLHQYTS